MSKDNPKIKVYAKNVAHGLEICLDVSGTCHHLSTHARSGLMYTWLKDGMTLGELARYKPGRSRSGQKKLHYAQYIAKLAKNHILQCAAS